MYCKASLYGGSHAVAAFLCFQEAERRRAEREEELALRQNASPTDASCLGNRTMFPPGLKGGLQLREEEA